MSPSFTSNGKTVFWRGDAIDAQQAASVLEIFRFNARWERAAQSLADELEQAMRDANYSTQEKAA